ncbi:hypothetical protein MG293_013786 [Ovis ammon polii]|uniref:Uncharacterized protein n=1 Tax=Ovis ammon polii TaxID=230172 RepID=A0AAD4Y671_OVIAM|nr:hypothetical protein MG293_013786 [Ovis ammon polii]
MEKWRRPHGVSSYPLEVPPDPFSAGDSSVTSSNSSVLCNLHPSIFPKRIDCVFFGESPAVSICLGILTAPLCTCRAPGAEVAANDHGDRESARFLLPSLEQKFDNGCINASWEEWQCCKEKEDTEEEKREELAPASWKAWQCIGWPLLCQAIQLLLASPSFCDPETPAEQSFPDEEGRWLDQRVTSGEPEQGQSGHAEKDAEDRIQTPGGIQSGHPSPELPTRILDIDAQQEAFQWKECVPIGKSCWEAIAPLDYGKPLSPVVSLQWRIEKEGTSLVPNPLLESYGEARLLQRAGSIEPQAHTDFKIIPKMQFLYTRWGSVVRSHNHVPQPSDSVGFRARFQTLEKRAQKCPTKPSHQAPGPASNRTSSRGIASLLRCST